MSARLLLDMQNLSSSCAEWVLVDIGNAKIKEARYLMQFRILIKSPER
jgi:hypothetical protein